MGQITGPLNPTGHPPTYGIPRCKIGCAPSAFSTGYKELGTETSRQACFLKHGWVAPRATIRFASAISALIFYVLMYLINEVAPLLSAVIQVDDAWIRPSSFNN